MPYCSSCGKEIPQGSGALCSDCTAALANGSIPSKEEITNRMNRSGKPIPADAPAGLDRSAFRKKYSVGARSCTAAAIMGYFSAGVTLILMFFNFMGVGAYLLIDIALILIPCLLVHILNSRIAAIVLLVYGLYNILFFLFTQGTFSGYLIVIAGVLAVTGAFTSAKEWREYQARTEFTAA